VPLTRRQILRRRRITVFGGAALVLSSAIYLPVTLLAPLSASSATVLPYSAPVTAAADLDWPSYGAGAIGAVGFPGVLASYGTDKQRPIASLSKVITVLVVLEKKPLEPGDDGPDITFGPADVQNYGTYLRMNALVLPVRSGLVLSERDVIELALLPSAANYATSLAQWAYGSDEKFLAAAKKWLKANDLNDITFTEPTGLSPKNAASTADLVELGKIALANPVVAELTSIKKDTIPGVGVIKNTNKLLGVQGVHGLKTGSLLEAGACLLFAADYVIGDETVTVVGVVLGGPGDDRHVTLDRDVRSLLKGVEGGFQAVTVATAGQAFASYTTEWGETVSAVAANDETIVVWGATPVTVLVEAAKITLADEGTTIGSVHITAGTQRVDVPLELSEAVEDPGPIWRLTHPIELL
jgi:serine-type D-Ala-D-Ala carboxypeptidase (penicillin-binding protein 5/6)